MMEELKRHGYDLGPGTLYPMLHKLEQVGYLKRQDEVVEGKMRKYYIATATGKHVLRKIQPKMMELISEVFVKGDSSTCKQEEQ